MAHGAGYQRLPCLDHDRYFLSADTHYSTRCIAPIRSFKQCSWEIDELEASEVRDLTAQLKEITVPTQREDVLRRISLLRCCGEVHRQKLEESSGTLRGLAERYVQILDSVADSEPCERIHMRNNTTRASPSLVNVPRYCLRPRKAGIEVASPQLDLISCFVAYPSDPRDDIRTVLCERIPPTRDMREGYVYAFTWPEFPGFTKIGYTRSDVERRMSVWRKCHPNAVVKHTIQVPFPERVERLIHLEMSRQRHQLILCKHCSRTHYEWFKVPSEKVIEIMETWRQLMRTEGFYTADRTLSELWREGLSRIKHELTASRLLGMYHAKSTLHQPAKRLGSKSERTEDAGTATQASKASKDQPKAHVVTSTPAALGKLVAKVRWSCDHDIISGYFNDFWLIV